MPPLPARSAGAREIASSCARFVRSPHRSMQISVKLRPVSRASSTARFSFFCCQLVPPSVPAARTASTGASSCRPNAFAVH